MNKQTVEYLPSTFRLKIPAALKDKGKLISLLIKDGIDPDFSQDYMEHADFLFYSNGDWFEFNPNHNQKFPQLSLEKLLKGQLAWEPMESFDKDYYVYQHRATKDVRIGCQSISFENFNKIIKSLNKNVTFEGMFEDEGTTVAIFPQKGIVEVRVNGENYELKAEKLKNLIKPTKGFIKPVHDKFVEPVHDKDCHLGNNAEFCPACVDHSRFS